jgi:hypothetical protein
VVRWKVPGTGRDEPQLTGEKGTSGPFISGAGRWMLWASSPVFYYSGREILNTKYWTCV